MSDTAEIEKKSLEAHVELCAARYRFLGEKLEGLESKVSELAETMQQIRDMVEASVHKRNDQIIAWSLAVMGTMVGMIGYLLAKYVFA